MSLLGALVMAGCEVETAISGGEAVAGVPNPTDLEALVQHERIIQMKKEKVDTIFVIDKSCSMAEEQLALAQNFERFIGYFIDSGLDWHVGVVSTDMADPQHSGKLRTYGGHRYIDGSIA